MDEFGEKFYSLNFPLNFPMNSPWNLGAGFGMNSPMKSRMNSGGAFLSEPDGFLGMILAMNPSVVSPVTERMQTDLFGRMFRIMFSGMTFHLSFGVFLAMTKLSNSSPMPEGHGVP